MKISINCKKIEGPYGGVIAFFRSLEGHLLKNGHKVVNHLNDNDIVEVSYTTEDVDSYNLTAALQNEFKLNDYLINEEKLYLFKCLKDKEEN